MYFEDWFLRLAVMRVVFIGDGLYRYFGDLTDIDGHEEVLEVHIDI